MIADQEKDPQSSRKIIVNGAEISVASITGQAKLVCAYLGPAGTFGEEATDILLGNQVLHIIQRKNEEIVKAVASGKSDIGVAPVENSSDNFVDNTLLELIKHAELKILGEQMLVLHQMLMGKPDAQRLIRSHKKALGQTKTFLDQNYPEVELKEDDSTALAVELAAKNNQMAIGSEAASRIYGLPIIARNIEDVKGNATRFFLVGQGETEPTGHDKTALIFTLDNRPGSFAQAYKIFERDSLNLEPQYMFPTGVIGEKLFMMTIDGHEKESHVQKAIAEFKKLTIGFRAMGSYRYTDPPKGTYLPELVAQGFAK